MDININTPALFFPAISLIMLAYTNRFLSLASIVRTLHSQYADEEKKHLIHSQIKNLKYRLRLIKNMQAFGVVSLLCCMLCIYFIYINRIGWANMIFGVAIIMFIISLVLSFIEIQHSTKALEIELSDMQGLEDPSIVEFIKSKFE